LHITDEQYEQIQAIQQAVNSEHEYETDQSGYGVGEEWKIMGPGDTGDCEDFALTKMQDLIDAGYNAKNLQIGWGFTEKGGAHAFLMIQTTNRGVLILDNRYPNIMEKSNVPYRFESYQRAGATWSNFTTKLEAVPVEYMTCNSLAFTDGDQVIVEFIGQDWNAPRVVGFRQNPQNCTAEIWLVHCSFVKTTTIAQYVEATETWFADFSFDNNYSRSYGAFTSNMADTLWYQGGYKDQFHAPSTPGTTDFIVKNTRIRSSTAVDRQDVPAPNRNYGLNFHTAGRVYLTGGTNYRGITPVSSRGTWADVDEFYEVIDAWAAKMPFSKRWGHSGFTLAGNGYAVGGHADLEDWRSGDTNFLDNVDQYNRVIDSWTAKNALYQGRHRPACFSNGGNGYIFSGEQVAFEAGAWDPGHGNWYYTNSLHEYDHNADIWTAKAPLDGSKGNSVYFPATASGVGGIVMALSIAGGISPFRHWNKSTDTWSVIEQTLTDTSGPFKLATAM
jgi:hypothetical protein